MAQEIDPCLAEHDSLAGISDNGLLAELPKIVAPPVHPEDKHFSESEYEDALSWLRKVGVPAGK